MRRPASKSNPVPTRAVAPVTTGPRLPVWLLAVMLVLATMAVYWPATRCDFVNYDDDLYVTANVQVQKGLTLENLKWAFWEPEVRFGYWHPLTLLSHMADCQLFGLKPWGHHLTSVLLHALNTVLVFLFLRSLTGALWRSALVAALFGLHPLHVESVAWVAERKDVLSNCFGLLALVFYARYGRKRLAVEDPDIKTRGVAAPRPTDYLLALIFFALGLMSKPVLVTWPFVMLLLDYWPLERFKWKSPWRLVTEKIPFFALAVAASIATFLMCKHAGAVAGGEALPLGARSGNALISYCRYLGKLFWPTNLAVFYPHLGYWPLAKVLLASGLMLGISVLLVVQRRRFPFLLMGWLWFCGTLVPTIGLVQVGGFAMADRYTYIPSLGVLILVVWGVYELTKSWHYRVVALSVAGSMAVVLCLMLTQQQIGHWRDSEALFRHTLEVAENNCLAHNNLGNALDKKGQVDEAIRQFQEAIRLKPGYAEAHYNLGVALDKKGQVDEAIRQLQEAVRLKPGYAEAHNNLGVALGKQGQTDEAIRQYQEALRLKPGYAEAHNNLGVALGKQGQTDEAMRQYQEALRLKPNYAETHYNLGSVLYLKGQMDEAIEQYQKAVAIQPENFQAHYSLGTTLLQKGRLDEAVAHFQKVLAIRPQFVAAYVSLGNALLQKGQVDDAIVQYQKAVASGAGDPMGIAHYSLGVALFQKGQIDEAIEQYQKALAIQPDHFQALYNLSITLLQKGRLDEAVAYFQKVLEIRPRFEPARVNLGNAFLQKGRLDEAIGQYQTAMEINPGYPDGYNDLAWVLSTCPEASVRNGVRAVGLAEKANQLSGGRSAAMLGTLAAAYAEAGRYSEAVETAQRAEHLAASQNDATQAHFLQTQIGLYRAGSPFRDTSQTNAAAHAK